MPGPALKVPGVAVFCEDVLDTLPRLPADSIDAVVTDPPYGLSNTDLGHVLEALSHWLAGDRTYVPHVGGGGFMGKDWDNFVPPPAAWDECFRVLKPGGHLLSFAGTRTIGLMEMTIRLAGFDIRDSLAWLYGSGFPKSLDVSKAIDKAAGAERTKVLGPKPGHEDFVHRTDAHSAGGRSEGWERAWRSDPVAVKASHMQLAPATPEAVQWQGWGTALKPAFEPIIVARKPFRGTVAANVLQHGTGALNIDWCRIEGQAQPFGNGTRRSAGIMGRSEPRGAWKSSSAGRWPANVVLDEDQAAALDEQSGEQRDGVAVNRNRSGEKPSTIYGIFSESHDADRGYGGSGGASRFFYCAKASRKERPVAPDGSVHPTVKPLALMRWLVRLVTPPNGIVLDPFVGSGTTAEAALLEGFRCLAVESHAPYIDFIRQRLDRAAA